MSFTFDRSDEATETVSFPEDGFSRTDTAELPIETALHLLARIRGARDGMLPLYPGDVIEIDGVRRVIGERP